MMIIEKNILMILDLKFIASVEIMSLDQSKYFSQIN
nr:MAG TPA: hypothetical protein [Caudoviricetes sp.]